MGNALATGFAVNFGTVCHPPENARTILARATIPGGEVAAIKAFSQRHIGRQYAGAESVMETGTLFDVATDDLGAPVAYDVVKITEYGY